MKQCNLFRQPGLARTLLLSLILVITAGLVRADTFEANAAKYNKMVQLGRSNLAGGHPKKAENIFSLALRIVPTDTKVQLSLAEAFARQGQVRKAESYLRYLLRHPDHRANSKLYLAALAQLYERYPFTGSGNFSILPSTNIENTSSNMYFNTLLGRFEIEDGGEETSGIGLELGAYGKYRHPLADGLFLEVGASLNHIWYDVKDLRYWRGRVTADVTRLSFSDDLRVGVHADRTYYPSVTGNSSDRMAIGAHGYWMHFLDDRTWLNLSALAEHRNYLEKDSLSGPFATIALRWTRRFPSGAKMSFGGSVERSRPSLAYHRYWGASVQAGYEHNLSDTFRAGLSVGASLRIYDTDFVAANYARRDEIFRVGLSLSDSRIKIFEGTPKLTCGYKIQNSNIALYETNSTDCRIGWEFRF